MIHRALSLLAAAAFATACLALGGCGLRDPDAQRESLQPASAAPAPLPQRSRAPATDLGGLLSRFAERWVNWSAPTLDQQRTALLALATGALARELRAQGAEARKAELLQVSRAYSRGRYLGQIGQGGGAAIVLTYEEVAPLGGQPQGAYRVYLARGERTARGWKLSEWQPASDG